METSDFDLLIISIRSMFCYLNGISKKVIVNLMISGELESSDQSTPADFVFNFVEFAEMIVPKQKTNTNIFYLYVVQNFFYNLFFFSI